MSLFHTVSNEMLKIPPITQTTTQIGPSIPLVYYPVDIRVVEPDMADIVVGMVIARKIAVDTTLAGMQYPGILDYAEEMMGEVELVEDGMMDLQNDNDDA
jgi:hypothetical protein